MNSAPEILQTTARPTAVIHLTIPHAEMMQAFGPAIDELMSVLAAQGLTPAGPVYAYHFKMSPGIFDLEVGVPVEGTVKPAGRVKPSQLPARKVARSVYTGPYEGLPDAWGEFDRWMKAGGVKQAEDLWECYVHGPGSDPDPKTWRTEMNRPLIG